MILFTHISWKLFIEFVNEDRLCLHVVDFLSKVKGCIVIHTYKPGFY